MVELSWPWALLLAPLPLLLRFWSADAVAGQGPDVPPRLAAALAVVSRDRRGGRRIPLLLTWAAWLLVVGALAQPSLIAGKTIQPASGRALLVALDLSTSMERKDFVLDGTAVDRLTAVKSVAADFVMKRKGDRLGLVLFGEQAFVAAPISYDLAGIANAVQEAAIGMAGRTTAIGDAIGLSIVKLRQDPATTKAIVLLSDGTNNSGRAEPEDAAALAGRLGIRIHTVGLGSERETSAGDPIDPSADLDEATLRRVAEISGGAFFRARTTEELSAIYGEIDALERSETEAPPFVPRLDVRNWLLLAAAILLAGLVAGRRAGTFA